MYRAIRTYPVLSGTSGEVLRRVQAGFVPIIRERPDFIGYEARPIGTDHVITSSTFATRTGAEASILTALRWVQENIAEFMEGVPDLRLDQMGASSELTRLPDAHTHQIEKMLAINLRFEVIHPSSLGKQAYTDPHVQEMVRAIGNLLTQMKADPLRRDAVIYRFERDIRPEEETQNLYTADHVMLITRSTKLAGYAEINRDTNAWLRRDRYEGDILVDPAAYRKDGEGHLVEKGIGERGLLEMRRQGRLLGIKDIELDVYLRNQPMHHFLGHLMTTHKLPFTKNEMTSGGLLDFTYVLSCKDASGGD